MNEMIGLVENCNFL